MSIVNEIFAWLFCSASQEENCIIFNPTDQFEVSYNEQDRAQKINAAFLICLCGEINPLYQIAFEFLISQLQNDRWNKVARFYLEGLKDVPVEINKVNHKDRDFSQRLELLLQHIRQGKKSLEKNILTEKVWSVFFPEGVGIRRDWDKNIKSLRSKRHIRITHVNDHPISDPIKEILFTANILLTLPQNTQKIKELPVAEDLRKVLETVRYERQKFWYDHPIQIGVTPEKNEVSYGLRALDQAIAYEKTHNVCDRRDKLNCVLSVSVTHDGLHRISRRYLEDVIIRVGGLKNLNLYAFTETETRQLINEVLVPAAEYYLNFDNDQMDLQVLGVDGEYGRHYSFLKAIAALWNVVMDAKVRATFKIDLDQVFPQQELVEQTDLSAFQHFKSPLWGAEGIDTEGRQVELGLIAGALVNKKDITKGLFTPDVKYPNHELSFDEHIFFSNLPQALSTEAEMMTRYNSKILDGDKTCLQRIHVTGGTNGILIDSLIKYRPFTPSFIARAEDQAYIMSVLKKAGPQLAYFHKDGLIMRHDKENFAREAIDAALIGKLIGDYSRILLFSHYAGILTKDINTIKATLDPFSGCFISKIPLTVVYLRFALKAAYSFDKGRILDGNNFILNGIQRLYAIKSLVTNPGNGIRLLWQKEQRGWNLYYDILATLKEKLMTGDPMAKNLAQKAQTIINSCIISSG